MAKHKHDWAEAKKLCRLNQNDIEMAKRLGFHPHSLVRARPSPKDKWKLPVKDWIHELHFRRFGHVIGEKPMSAVAPPPPLTEEEIRRIEEEFYWEDYHARNTEPPAKRRPGKDDHSKPTLPAVSSSQAREENSLPDIVFFDSDPDDRDVPF